MTKRLVLSCVVGAAAAAALLFQADTPRAETCTSLTVKTADLPGKTLELYSEQKKYLDDAGAKQLGASFIVRDCGDPTFFKFRLGDRDLLVRRISIKNIVLEPLKCVCASSSANPSTKTQGLPMAGDVNYCPTSQCPR